MAQNSCEKVKKYEKLREHDISQLLVFRAIEDRTFLQLDNQGCSRGHTPYDYLYFHTQNV